MFGVTSMKLQPQTHELHKYIEKLQHSVSTPHLDAILNSPAPTPYLDDILRGWTQEEHEEALVLNWLLPRVRAWLRSDGADFTNTQVIYNTIRRVCGICGWSDCPIAAYLDCWILEYHEIHG